MLLIPYTTADYIKIPLTRWSPDTVDPTVLPVELALTLGDVPADLDFVTASWVTEQEGNPLRDVVKARALWPDLVAEPAPSTVYTAWMRVTASPETPVMYAGTIRTR